MEIPNVGRNKTNASDLCTKDKETEEEHGETEAQRATEGRRDARTHARTHTHTHTQRERAILGRKCFSPYTPLWRLSPFAHRHCVRTQFSCVRLLACVCVRDIRLTA